MPRALVRDLHVSAPFSVVTCGGPTVPFQKEDNDDADGISILYVTSSETTFNDS